MEPLIKFWLFLCHWVQFDTSEDQETIDDIIDTLDHAGLPYKTRTRAGQRWPDRVRPLRQECGPGLCPVLHRLAPLLKHYNS